MTVVLVAGPPSTSTSEHRIELEHGTFLLSRPANVNAHAPAPLIICLHGTDDDAEDMLAFWRARDAQFPFVLVAPQSQFSGWADTDLPFLREMLEYLFRTQDFDPQRVLLTGHSAGGAMAMHLMYAEDFPATALAVTATYLPPTVTAERFAKHHDIPVFWAVGQADGNLARMVQGIKTLQAAGIRVHSSRPAIGHVLDAQVGDAVVKWFETQCHHVVKQTLENARRANLTRDTMGVLLEDVYDIVAHADVYAADQVDEARELITAIESSVRAKFVDADRMVREHRPGDARGLLLDLEARFLPSRLGVEARSKRAELESTARMARSIAPDDRAVETSRAALSWEAIDRAMSRRRIAEALRQCRALVTDYPKTEFAERARALMSLYADQAPPTPDEVAS